MSYKAVNEAMGEWLGTMAVWDWYCTFTFRDPCSARYPNWTQIGVKAANNALNKWNAHIVNLLDWETTGGNPEWVACMEPQDRGVPHWHILAGNVGHLRRLDEVDWWYEHYGIARVFKYDPELGARYYVGKYVTKRLSDIRFSPALAAHLAKGGVRL